MLKKIKLLFPFALLLISFSIAPATTSAAADLSVHDPAADSNSCKQVPVTASNCDLISKYLNPFINTLAALVGVAVVIAIVIGAIQYGSSAGDPQRVAAAKARIRNALVALITFIFLYALLNFLIPGGLV